MFSTRRLLAFVYLFRRWRKGVLCTYPLNEFNISIPLPLCKDAFRSSERPPVALPSNINVSWNLRLSEWRPHEDFFSLSTNLPLTSSSSFCLCSSVSVSIASAFLLVFLSLCLRLYLCIICHALQQEEVH